MTIDVHTHLFPPEVSENRIAYLDDPQFALLYSDEKSRLVNQEHIQEYMRRDQVDHIVALAFPWIKPEYCSLHNQFMANVDRSSGIIPFGAVPMETSSNVETYVKEIASLELAGIGEVAFYHTGFNEEQATYLDRLLDAAEQHNLPVNLHLNEPLGHPYTGKYLPRFDLLFPVLQKHEDAIIIMAHWGGGLPFYELMPEVGSVSRNWYYDTAASPFLYDKSMYAKMINLVGKERILLGTDYPLLGMKRYREGLDSLGEDERHALCHKNAERLFNL